MEALLTYTMEIIKLEICATALFGYMSPFCSGCSPAARGSFSSHPHASGGKGPQSLDLVLLGLSQGSKLKRERATMSPRKGGAEEAWQFRFVDFGGITYLCIWSRLMRQICPDLNIHRFAQLSAAQNLKSWVAVALQAGQLSSGTGNTRTEHRSVNAWESGWHCHNEVKKVFSISTLFHFVNYTLWYLFLFC